MSWASETEWKQTADTQKLGIKNICSLSKVTVLQDFTAFLSYYFIQEGLHPTFTKKKP
jgi:hypothetical protein